jgi:hypothetical protein
MNGMSKEYNHYILEHKHNVQKAHSWLKWNLPDIAKGTLCDDNIEDHDDTKWYPGEYDAYDAYFYGKKTEEVKAEFNLAWLRHIHSNPHHWQHWVLVNDDPENGSIGLEMDYKYVIEMICDWWSFSWKTGNLYEIFDWYEKHKSYMILHENTRKIVEDVLSKIKEVLDAES